MESQELLKKLLDIQKAYASVFRFTTTDERVSRAIKNKEKVNFLDEKLREPLIEHIGHLPILATTLYSHIQERNKINLGKVLIMLAIHDIGETVLGDMITFKKTAENEEREKEVALKLLPDGLDPYLLEIEEGKTLDAKFAISVDKLAPLLRDLERPESIPGRHSIHKINSELIITKKLRYFEWNPTLLSLFNLIIERYKDTEK